MMAIAAAAAVFIACPFCQETGGVFHQLARAAIQFFTSAMGSTGVPAAVSQAAVKTAAMIAIRIGKIRLRVIAGVLSCCCQEKNGANSGSMSI